MINEKLFSYFKMAYIEENLPAVSEQNIVGSNDLSLEKCFKNIIEGHALELSLDNLKHILGRDLQLNFYVLKPKVKSVISYMLVHFIKSWPGWQKKQQLCK
ncbi:hypothetical protein NQ314_015463 [Rhamnusium bicolor]|uniref:Uncharacterized protein n=1 Tax=Rhamnusium bicolor TaxID=1586634 RepID=A0AAV8X119_9CUCU|nr:hypothetical protein NQ314_015463 [Rhamnusium bicolor]